MRFGRATLIAGAWLACVATAQAQGTTKPASTAPQDAASACKAVFNAEHAQVLADQKKLNAARKPDSLEAKEFAEIEARLTKHLQAATAAGLTVDACTRLRAELIREKMALLKLEHSVPAEVTACMKLADAEHGQILALHSAAKAGGQIDKAEEASFKAMEGALDKHKAALAKSGATILDCEDTRRELAVERTKLQRMAGTSPEAKQCLATFNAEHAKLLTEHKAALANKKLDAREEQEYKAIEGRLRQHITAAAKGGVTVGECTSLRLELVREHTALWKLIYTDPKVVEACMKLADAEHGQILALHSAAKAGGQIDKAEEATFKAMEGALAKHKAALAKNGVTILDCEDTRRELAVERTKLERMAGTSPEAKQCLATFNAEHAKLLAEHKAALANKKLDAKEEQEYKAIEGRLRQHMTAAAKGGVTVGECSSLRLELVREHTALWKLVYTDPKVVEACVNLVDAAHAMLLARHTHWKDKISKNWEASFKATEASLSKHKAALSKGGITILDCEAMRVDLAAEQVKLDQATQPLGATGACIARFNDEIKKVNEQHKQFLAEKKLDAKEEQEFKAIQARMNKHVSASTKNGLTLAECTSISMELAAEHSALWKLAYSGAGDVAACLKSADADHANILAQYQAAMKSGKIDKAEEGTFKTMETNLAKHKATLSKGGVTILDCEAMRRDLAGEQAKLTKMAATMAPAPSAATGWVAVAVNGATPTNAVDGGGSAATPLQVCRAKGTDGVMRPGKAFRNTCYIFQDDKEIRVQPYEALVQSGTVWVAAVNGNAPAKAVEGGPAVGGAPVHICRTKMADNLMHAGMAYKGTCYAGYAGKGIKATVFEVLAAQ